LALISGISTISWPAYNPHNLYPYLLSLVQILGISTNIVKKEWVSDQVIDYYMELFEATPQ
jgi:hypothetical protein